MPCLILSARSARTTCYRVNNVNRGAGRYRRVEPLEKTYVFLLKENIDIGAKFARLVTDVEADAGMRPLQRVDHLTDGFAAHLNRPPATGATRQDGRNPDRD